jgi:hypothetical protein
VSVKLPGTVAFIQFTQRCIPVSGATDASCALRPEEAPELAKTKERVMNVTDHIFIEASYASNYATGISACIDECGLNPLIISCGLLREKLALCKVSLIGYCLSLNAFSNVF